MVVGVGGRGRPGLLAATGHAARASTVPWTPGSFLGKALVTHAGEPLEESKSHFHDAGSVPPAWHAIASQILGSPAGSLGAIYAGWEHASNRGRRSADVGCGGSLPPRRGYA